MNPAVLNGLLLLFGAGLVVAGIALRFGAPWALITAGVMCIARVIHLTRGPADGG